MCLLVFLMAYDLSPFCSVTGCLCLFCIRRYVSDCFPVPSSSVAHSFIFFLLPPRFFSFLFFFLNQIRCSILLFHSVSLTVSSVVLWGTGMSVSNSHASVFRKRRKRSCVKQKNKDDFSTLFSFMEKHNKERIISAESKQCLTLPWSFRVVLLLVYQWY